MKRLNFSPKVSVLCVLIFCMVSSSFGQNIDTRGRISNSVYALQNNDTTSVRLYQYVRFTAKARDWNNLAFNLAARVLTDTEIDLPDEKRFRAFRLSLSGRNYFNNLLDFEIGRQFFHPGLPLGSLDGLNVTLKPFENFSWQLFGGVETHLARAMKVYKPEEATVYGTNIKYRNLYSTDVQVAFLEKRTKDDTQWRLIGLNFSNYALKQFNFQAQAHYDMVNKRMHRVYAMGKYLPSTKLNFMAHFKMQYPQIYGDSFFRIFEVKNVRHFGLSGWYEFMQNYFFSVTGQMIQLEEGDGIRIFADIGDRNGSIGVIYETGDLGEQIGVRLNYGYNITPDLIASIYIDYSRYRFEEIYSFENQMGNAARLTYHFSRNWRVDAEYQWLTNRFKDSDHRFLNHIYYLW